MQNQDDSDDNEQGILIRQAREKRGLSQADLGRKVGTSQQTVEKIEGGKIKHSRYITKIGLELGLDIARLLPELATQFSDTALIPESDLRSSNRDFPVHAAAQGGRGELIVSTDPVAWILRAAPLVGVSRAYGIIVVGDSMVPELWPGNTALI